MPRSRTALAVGLVIPCLLVSVTQVAGEDLRAALVAGAIAFHNENSVHVLAEPGHDATARLLAGEIVLVRRRLRTDDEERALDWVFAYALTRAPKLHLWLAATRPGVSAGTSIDTHALERHDDGRSRNFLHARLPWPLADRYWIANVAMDVEIAELSGDRIWARRWDLEPCPPERARALAVEGRLGPLAPGTIDTSLPLSANRGSLLVFDLDGEHSLVAYATALALDEGTNQDWMAGFVSELVRTQVERVLRDAESARADYRDDAPRVVDGRGRPIARFDESAR